MPVLPAVRRHRDLAWRVAAAAFIPLALARPAVATDAGASGSGAGPSVTAGAVFARFATNAIGLHWAISAASVARIDAWLARRTPTRLDDALVLALAASLTLAWSLAVVHAGSIHLLLLQPAYRLIHPRIRPDRVVVQFVALTVSSLDIEVIAWFDVTEPAGFAECRREILIVIMKAVEGADTEFAFPTQTIHLPSGTAPLSRASSSGRVDLALRCG